MILHQHVLHHNAQDFQKSISKLVTEQNKVRWLNGPWCTHVSTTIGDELSLSLSQSALGYAPCAPTSG